MMPSSPCALLDRIASTAGPGSGSGLSDGDLLRQFIDGRSEVAFRALVQRHGPMVMGVARRVLRDHHDSEDVVQATFLVLARRAATVRNHASLGAWLYPVAFQAALRVRTMRARHRKAQGDPNGLANVPARPVAPTIEPDLARELDEELARLPDALRDPIVLCELQGCSRREAALRLGVPEGTLSSRLAEAKRRLRIRLMRRGVTAGVATASLTLATGAAAGLPGSVARSAAQAAASGPAGAVSHLAIRVADEIIKSLTTAQLKSAVSWGLMLALAGGIAGVGPVGGSSADACCPLFPRARCRPYNSPAPVAYQVPENRPPTIVSLTTEQVADQRFRIKGRIFDETPVGVIVTGAANGVAMCDSKGNFDAIFNVPKLDKITCVPGDGTLTGPPVTRTLSNAAPTCSMSVTKGPENTWTFRGAVSDEAPGGLRVTLSGPPGVDGTFATVAADGSWTVALTLRKGTTGKIAATVRDWYGETGTAVVVID